MATFTSEEKRLKVCEILGINSIRLEVQLDAYVDHVTAAVETRVDRQIDRWEDEDNGVGEDFDTIDANTKNFGLNSDPGAARADIRSKIAKLLFFTEADLADAGGAGAGDTFIIERG